jgi:hypothetical protein
MGKTAFGLRAFEIISFSLFSCSPDENVGMELFQASADGTLRSHDSGIHFRTQSFILGDARTVRSRLHGEWF